MVAPASFTVTLPPKALVTETAVPIVWRLTVTSFARLTVKSPSCRPKVSDAVGIGVAGSGLRCR